MKTANIVRKYLLNVAMQQPVEWLRKCLANPNGHETPLSVACIKLAIRKKTGR